MTENNHFRPWEKVPQSVLNLLDMHSLVAFWDVVHPGSPQREGWRVLRMNDVRDWQMATQTGTKYPPYCIVPNGAPLEEWVAAVEVTFT